MLIKTDRRTYKVVWEAEGFTYARPCVAVETKVLFGLFTRWKEVWSNPYRLRVLVETADFDEIKAWFIEAVRQYEKYEDSGKRFEKVVDLRTKPDPVKPNKAVKAKPVQELRFNKDGVYEAE